MVLSRPGPVREGSWAQAHGTHSNYPRKATQVELAKVGENKVLSLNELYDQRERNDKDDIRKGASGQPSQVSRRQ